MKAGNGHVPDVTGETAVGSVSDRSLMTSVLLRISDELDRKLIVAHVALGQHLSAVARQFGLDEREAAERVRKALETLSQDDELATALRDIGRAGRPEDHYALALQHRLQDWFCSQCGRAMSQPEVGRQRKTCDMDCRRLLSKARGASWKDHFLLPPPELRAGRKNLSIRPDTPERRQVLSALLGAITDERRYDENTRWWRDRAILLLGAVCPASLTPLDLAALDQNDLALTQEGLELRLYRRVNQPTQYIRISLNSDDPLCPARATLEWRELLDRAGHKIGPLFVLLDRRGRIPRNVERITCRTIASVINTTVQPFWLAQQESPRITYSTPLAAFLDRLADDPYFDCGDDSGLFRI